MLFIQTDPGRAYLCRSFGMIGTFLYLISAQFLVCRVSGRKTGWNRWVEWFSLLGIPIYFMVVQKGQTVYLMGKMGMTYYFKAGIVNTLYTLYSVLVAFHIFTVSISMFRKSEQKRGRIFGRSLLLTEGLIAAGMVLDTVVPMLGISMMIPGSSLTQFLGLIVTYRAVYALNRTYISITNMSEFIYNSLSMPVLLYDTMHQLQIMNDASSGFLEVKRETEGAVKNIRMEELFVLEGDIFDFPEEHLDLDAVCRTNQVYCSLAISKIRDIYGDIIGYIVFVTDQTERRNTMQKLENAVQEAESANRAKSVFLANMSHEIRTPLNAIIGFSELLLNMSVERKEREYVEDIKGASISLLAVINDILDISRIESGKMELVCDRYHTAGLFRDVFLIIENPAKKKGLNFRMELAPDIPNELYGDKTRVRGVLVNLLNNAVKYTQEGEILLAARVVERRGDKVRMEIRVSDTGVGIRKEDLGKLFDSFTRVDEKQNYRTEGSGLGLSIVQGYVRLMNGSISVESVYGEGSTFIAVLEQTVVDGNPMEDICTKEEDDDSGFHMRAMRIMGIHVLVVDDNEVNLKVAGSSMSHYGLTVDLASSGKEAIELCRKNRYQMVFMDQMMPEMDGVEAMQQIRRLDSYYDVGGGCKIVALTANAITGVRAELLEQGFDEYLGKPINFTRLEQIFVEYFPKENIEFLEEESTAEQGSDIEQELEDILKDVNVKQGIAICGGNIEDYIYILQTVYRDGEKLLKELQKLQQKGDYAGYTIKIHALKGMAMNIGATDVAELAKQLEKSGREGDYAYIDAQAERFAQQYRQQLSDMQRALLRCGIEVDSGSTEEETDIRKVLEQIEQRLEEFDYAGASELIREAKESGAGETCADLLDRLGQWMAELAIEQMEDAIEAYLAGNNG